MTGKDILFQEMCVSSFSSFLLSNVGGYEKKHSEMHLKESELHHLTSAVDLPYALRVIKVLKCCGHIVTRFSLLSLAFTSLFNDSLCYLKAFFFLTFLSFSSSLWLNIASIDFCHFNPLKSMKLFSQPSCLPPYSPHFLLSDLPTSTGVHLASFPVLSPTGRGWTQAGTGPNLPVLSECANHCPLFLHTVYTPLHFGSAPAPQTPDLAACFWPNISTSQQQYWLWSLIHEWRIFIVRGCWKNGSDLIIGEFR